MSASDPKRTIQLLNARLFPVRARRHINERRDQTRQSLLFWAISMVEKHAQFDVRKPAARGAIRLVDDEGSPVLRLAAEIPAVAIRAAIELSPIRHNCLLRSGTATSGRYLVSPDFCQRHRLAG